MSPARIAAHTVANGGANFTDARTACLATRYTARTARMVEQAIGARTLMAMGATAFEMAAAQFRFLRRQGGFHQTAGVVAKFLAD
jgi:hypothetical protein